MQIVQVVETLVASVMLANIKRENKLDEDSYVSFILKEYEKCIKNLNFLPFSDDVIDEAKYIVTVFVDEKMMVSFPSWKLLQLKIYNSNRGGEDFYTKLEEKLEKSDIKENETLSLIEMYNYFVALGFRGCFWRDPKGKIPELRSRMNQILAIDSKIILCNQSGDFSKNLQMSHFDNKTLFSIIVMIVIFIFLLLCLNDVLSLHSDIWDSVNKKLQEVTNQQK